MAQSPIFDTNTVATHSQEIEGLFEFAFFPSVVFFELVATSIDETTFKRYIRWRNALKVTNRILTPTENDWWETAKAIRRMYLTKVGQESKLKTLRLDALIARLSVKRKDTFIVTYDIDDFQLIKKVMPDLKVKSATEFFR